MNLKIYNRKYKLLLLYTTLDSARVVGYNGSDYSRDPDERKVIWLYVGYMFTIGSAAFSWLSKKQPL